MQHKTDRWGAALHQLFQSCSSCQHKCLYGHQDQISFKTDNITTRMLVPAPEREWEHSRCPEKLLPLLNSCLNLFYEIGCVTAAPGEVQHKDMANTSTSQHRCKPPPFHISFQAGKKVCFWQPHPETASQALLVLSQPARQGKQEERLLWESGVSFLSFT